MGFDFSIELVLHLCAETGKPFYYGKNPEGNLYKEYDISGVIVPEEYRRFLQGRGSIFHAYTHKFSYNETYTVDIHDLLDEFPSWEEVRDSDWYDENEEGWTEEEHDEFKNALTWFTENHLNFQATWSY